MTNPADTLDALVDTIAEAQANGWVYGTHPKEKARIVLQAIEAASWRVVPKQPFLDPDMPTQELRLHMGELTTDEALVARAAIRWANSRIGDSDAR